MKRAPAELPAMIFQPSLMKKGFAGLEAALWLEQSSPIT